MSFFELVAIKVFAAISGIVALISGAASPLPVPDVTTVPEVYLQREEAAFIAPETAQGPVIYGNLAPLDPEDK